MIVEMINIIKVVFFPSPSKMEKGEGYVLADEAPSPSKMEKGVRLTLADEVSGCLK